MSLLRKLLQNRVLVGKGLLMAEQDLTVAHRDDVVMKNYPARQTLEASQAVARLNQVNPRQLIFARQHPEACLKGLPRRIATWRLLASPTAAIDK
jgi:hypothetical protein